MIVMMLPGFIFKVRISAHGRGEDVHCFLPAEVNAGPSWPRRVSLCLIGQVETHLFSLQSTPDMVLCFLADIVSPLTLLSFVIITGTVMSIFWLFEFEPEMYLKSFMNPPLPPLVQTHILLG